MRRVLIFVFLGILLALPVRALELEAPPPPSSAQELLPKEADSFGEGLWNVLREAGKRIAPSMAEAAGCCLRVFAVVLLAVLWLPVFRITGDSMAETLNNDDIVVAWRSEEPERGEMIAFTSENNKTLVKRVIAVGGDTVNIRTDGSVLVNGVLLDEPYLTGKAFGECDIEFPLDVPDV